MENTGDLFIAKLDGTVTAVIVESKSQQITIYPNPARDKLTIEFDEDKLFDVGITLINILGEVVFSSTFENIAQEKTIDVSGLTTGIYFVELEINGVRVMKKVVKE